MKIPTLFLAVVAGTSLVAQAGNWPSWRGTPDGSGASEQTGTPTTFSPTENVTWKVKLPGPGNSTPVVWGDKIFLTCGIEGKDSVVTYDTKGKELWRASYGKEVPGKGKRVGTGSNSSPVTDGEHVFAYFKSGRVAGLTADGKKLWDLSLTEKYGKDHLWWDQGSSPVLAGGHVILTVMQTEGNSYLVALDKKTGEVAWHTERKFDVAPESGDAYTTPLVMSIDGVETIVNWGADHLTGHDAKTGKLIWTCAGFNPEKNKYWRVIASAAATNGIVIVPFARGDSVAGVKVGGKGDITEEAILWKRDDLGSDSASPVAHNGTFLILKDGGKTRGTVTAVDAITGKTLWQSNLPKGPQQYYASPTPVGDKLYCARESGSLFCATVTDKGLTDIVENKLEETLIASPIALDGKLLVRGRDHLFCFGK